MKRDIKPIYETDRHTKVRDREQMTFDMVFSSLQQVKLSEYCV